MASKSTHSLLDFSENRPLEGIGRSNSSNSLTGESSSAARVKMNGLFVSLQFSFSTIIDINIFDFEGGWILDGN